MKKILVTGSLAYDYIMHFSDIFSRHILPHNLNILNVSFTADKMSKNFGGTAGNISYSLALLKESPIVFSTVGRDFIEYKNKLEQDGVDTSFVHVDQQEWTASAHIITDQSHNQITAFYGGAMLKNDLSLSHILKQKKISCAIIAANGKFGMIRYAKEFKEHGIPYIYDPGQSLPSCERDDLLTLTEGAWILVMNEYEKELFLSKTYLKESALLDMIEYLIITKGERGSVLYHKGEKKEIHAVKCRNVLDPTGAGDAFRGGLLKGLVHNLPIEDCLEMASLAGCYAVEYEGTQSYHYTIEEFQKRFQENYGSRPYWKDIF
ncbi:MAG: carbohydrate kinase family protein [Candidatus Brocadiae bacterium]|nr:carbohydrate kinase family protein [Candidatus Brocadiia bacterium]